jgi:hypothetical protein
MWTYYRQVMPSGDYRLYRVDERRRAQSFNRREGWIAAASFFDKLQKGDLAGSDIVDAENAARLAADKAEADEARASADAMMHAAEPSGREKPAIHIQRHAGRVA